MNLLENIRKLTHLVVSPDILQQMQGNKMNRNCSQIEIKTTSKSINLK